MGRRQGPTVNQTPKYLVPKNTAAVLSASASRCQHLGLFLGRYTPQQVVDPDTKWDKKRTWRDHWLKDKVIPRFKVSEPWLTALQDAIYARWREATAGAETFQARSKSRLIVGLGGKGVLEVGITLQHVTGLPIIPGSALKGLARTYALLTIAEKVGIPTLNPKQLQQLQPDRLASPLEILDAALVVASDEQRKKALMPLIQSMATINHPVDGQAIDQLEDALRRWSLAQYYRAAFGSQEDSGDCIFYDAVIAALPDGHLFELDVMTPHFKEYYDDVNSGHPQFNKAPDDAQSPNPIGFVTVAAGATFAFAVGPRQGSDSQVVKQAVKWLKEALAELGVGAKTAAGYGVFEVIP